MAHARNDQFKMLFIYWVNVFCYRSIVILQSEFLLEVLKEHPGHLTPSIQVPAISYADMCSIIRCVIYYWPKTETFFY